MRSYPVRLVLVLRCTCIYHHTSGGLVKYVQILWLVQTLRPCAKSLLQMQYLFLGVQQRSSSACSHLKMSPISNEPFCEVLVLISCVSSIGSNRRSICAVLKEHLLLGHSVFIAYAHTCNHFFTCRCNYPVGYSSKFWRIHVVCARIEGAYENV